MTSIKDKPNKYPLPPLLTVGMIGICYLMEHFLSLEWLPSLVISIMRPVGWIVIGLAIAIDVWAMTTFRQHHANIMPHKAATQLLNSGPFAYSRNPIYLANIMLITGLGLAFGNLWMLLGAPVLILLLRELAIKREEAHLEANFQQAWQDYEEQVRRWI